MMRNAVFIDRDGTLIKDIPYNSCPELIRFEDYAIEFLQDLKRRNYLLIVISNQSGVALGYFSEENVYKMHAEIRRMLLPHNVQIDAFYYCPHLPGGKMKYYAKECDCRKPKPGLIYKAAKMFNIDLNNSWMIGDILNDIEAGNTAGCKTILINNGNETEWRLTEVRIPDYDIENLQQAAEIILKHELANV
jgi:D-glycero-D-manno-heptose 1,7-bisphosphate phosphatase